MTNEPQPTKALLTVKEAARYLGISHTVVYHMINAGEMPYMTIGGNKAKRIPLKALLAWIEANTIMPQRHAER